MAQNTPKTRRVIASCLTAIFMTAACAGQADAFNIRVPYDSIANRDNDRTCTQTITQEELKRKTGFSNLEDFRTASAYSSFLRQMGQNPAAVHAILSASEETGVDFDLLIVKAMLESDLGRYDRPIHVDGAARGLYQFMPTTWLTLFAWFGDQYNDRQYRDLADAIRFDSRGNPYVNDQEKEQQILNLRNDYYISSFIKAMQIKHEDRPVLRNMLRHEPEIVDFYVVHFLGIPRAREFYDHLRREPDQAAADHFAREARYNRFVFYQNGQPLSFRQVYDRLDGIVTDRLEDVHEITDRLLQQENCIPPLKKDQRPAQPAPHQEMRLYFPPHLQDI